MTNPVQPCTSILHSNLRRTAFALALVCALTVVAMPSAQAQTFSVIHSFSGGEDGYTPYAGVTIDQAATSMEPPPSMTPTLGAPYIR
jgi:PAB1-binding protein PBP1